MLVHTETSPAPTFAEQEKSNMIKAVREIFFSRDETYFSRPGRSAPRAEYQSISRRPLSSLLQKEGAMDYELLHIMPIREGVAMVKVRQTPLDRHGHKITEGASSPLLVIAKSGDEWEIVGLPLPLHSLVATGCGERR